MRNIILICLIILSIKLNAQGPVDGFMKGSGNTDIALSISYETSDIFFAGENEINLSRNLLSASIFAAHGISDKIDLIANVPVINGKLQDGGLYVRYLAYDSQKKNPRFTILPSVGISAPLSKYPTEQSNSIGQQAVVLTTQLSGQFMTENGFFSNLTGKYHAAFDPVPSSIVVSAKAGIAKEKWYADLWYEKQIGIGGKDYRGSGDLAPTSFRQLGVSHDKLGLTFYYVLSNKIGLFVSGAQVLEGRNTGKASRGSAGLVFKIIKTDN